MTKFPLRSFSSLPSQTKIHPRHSHFLNPISFLDLPVTHRLCNEAANNTPSQRQHTGTGHCILALAGFSRSRPHCMLGNSEKFGRRSLHPPLFAQKTKSTATPTYHPNFALAVFFAARKFQNMPC